MKGRLKYFLTALYLLAAVSCGQPYSPSNQDVFMEQKDVCMVAGQKEYIGGASVSLVQSSYNPVKRQFRAGNVEQVRDETTGCTVDLVNDYFVLYLDGIPAEAGKKVSGYLYLKHRSLPNSFRTYGSESAPIEFDILKVEGSRAWLWAPSIKIGTVIKTGAEQ